MKDSFVYRKAKNVFKICAPVLNVTINICIYLLNKHPTNGSPTLKRLPMGVGRPVVVMVMNTGVH